MPAPKKSTAKPAPKQASKPTKKMAPAPKSTPAKVTKPTPKAEKIVKKSIAEETSKSCGCGPDCKCGPNCQCGPDCKCGPNCQCGDESCCQTSSSSCCSTGSCASETFMGCHVAGLLTKRVTWVSFITSLALLWFTNALIHGWWLAARYQETSSFWLPQNDMKYGLILASEIITALAITLIFRLAYRGYGYVEGAKLGVLAMLPMAGAASLMTVATQPIPADIAFTWGISQLLQGALVGLALAGISKCPPAHGSCCGTSGSCCSKENKEGSTCCKN